MKQEQWLNDKFALKQVLLLGFILLVLPFTTFGQTSVRGKMKFTSFFGSFTMDNPYGWTQIQEDGVASFEGKIAMDNTDTLEFDYGFWSSLLSKDKLLLSLDGTNYTEVIKRESQIDGYNAYLSGPEPGRKGTTCLYIDSLCGTWPTITKFIICGNNLSKKNQSLFFEVTRTLKFETHH